MTLAVFHSVGKVDVVRIVLNIYVMTELISSKINLRNFGGISSMPIAFDRTLRRARIVSSGVIQLKEKCPSTNRLI